MEEVAQEMENRGVKTHIEEGKDGRVWLEVLHGEEMDFFYSERPREYEPPAFTLSATCSRPGQDRKYYQPEVHLREGGQDYDLMNWTREQVITDILDQYEKHLQFLDIYR